jgi:hypothetical protein
VAKTKLFEAAKALGPYQSCVGRGCGCFDRTEVLDNKLPNYDCKASSAHFGTWEGKIISAGLFMLTLSSLVRLAKIALMMGQVPMWKVRSSALWQRRQSEPWEAGHVWRVTTCGIHIDTLARYG